MAGGSFLHLNSTEIFYTTQGNETGIPFLLVHGLATDQTDWAFQTAFLVLSQVFYVVAMDLRGHGRSTFFPSCSAIMDPVSMANDAAALLEHLGVAESNKAVVMGHSLGGTVVTELVHARPDLVRGQVLVDPSYYLTPEVVDGLTPDLEKNFDSAIATFWESAAYAAGTPDYLKEWHKLRAWGGDEKLLTAAWSQMGTAQGLSGADYLMQKKVARIPRLVMAASEASKEVEEATGIDDHFEEVHVLDVGHWIMKAAPERFEKLLQNWLVRWDWVEG